MTDALSPQEYEEEVNSFANRLVKIAEELTEAGDFESQHDAVVEMVSEELDYHNWFVRSYYDGSLYGSVIDHANADVERYSDWQSLIETNSPERTLKRLAYCVMEADALDRALDRIDD